MVALSYFFNPISLKEFRYLVVLIIILLQRYLYRNFFFKSY